MEMKRGKEEEEERGVRIVLSLSFFFLEPQASARTKE